MLHYDTELYIMSRVHCLPPELSPAVLWEHSPSIKLKIVRRIETKKVKYLLRHIRSAVIYVTWVSEMGLLVHPVGMFLTTLTRNESEDLSLPCFFPQSSRGFLSAECSAWPCLFVPRLWTPLWRFSSQSYRSTGSFSLGLVCVLFSLIKIFNLDEVLVVLVPRLSLLAFKFLAFVMFMLCHTFPNTLPVCCCSNN